MREGEESEDKIEMFRTMQLAGRLGPDDVEPIFPFSRQYLFSIFTDLDRQRGSSGFGPSPLTYRDIESYCRLMSMELSPWDVRMLREMDDVMMKAARVSAAGKAKAQQKAAGRQARRG